MQREMPSLEKSPWVLREAPKQLVCNLFQFSVQRLLRMSPVVIMHLGVETAPRVVQLALRCQGPG